MTRFHSDRYALDEVRWVTIGGVPQALHVLARSPVAPVLLFLHGGPAVSHMPFTYVNADLAESFVIVQWDQAGAGKTYCASPQRIPRSIEDIVADAVELIHWLCAEFGREQIILVGHSCGSIVGTLVAARHPECIRALVNVAQVTDLQTAEFIRFAMVNRLATQRHDRACLQRLADLGPPPYGSMVESDELEAMAATITGDCLDPLTDERFAPLARASRLCTDDELSLYARGTRISQRTLWPALVNQLQLARQVPSLDVPVAFIVGGRDLFAPVALAEEFFHNVRAHLGKVFCRLDGVGHWMHLQSPAVYRAALKSVLGCCEN